MKKSFFALALSSVFILSGCSLYGNSSGTNNSMPMQASSQAAPVSTNAISIQNFAFNPGVITVAKGTTVTWTNNDTVPHQLKSVTFNSAQLSKGQTFSFTFNDAGTFDYSCAIHPSMKGTVVVQ